MRKNLKLAVFSVVLCAVSALNVKMMLDTEHFGDLSLISLAAIGEGGSSEGSSGENSGDNNQTPCHTVTNASVSMQDCSGVQMYARITITYTCEGKKLGLCNEGVEYYFYDCEGSMIKNSEYITSKSCGQ